MRLYFVGLRYTIVYMYFRGVTGEIRGEAYIATDRNGPPVPSFGPFLDDFLDRFGYTSSFIELLYDALSASPTRADFVMRCGQRGVARLEAEWFYQQLSGMHPLDLSMRRRQVVVPL